MSTATSYVFTLLELTQMYCIAVFQMIEHMLV